MSGIKMCNFLDLNPLNFLPFEKREGGKKRRFIFIFIIIYFWDGKEVPPAIGDPKLGFKRRECIWPLPPLWDPIRFPSPLRAGPTLRHPTKTSVKLTTPNFRDFHVEMHWSTVYSGSGFVFSVFTIGRLWFKSFILLAFLKVTFIFYFLVSFSFLRSTTCWLFGLHENTINGKKLIENKNIIK